jgi:DNA-directed RNA polymerase delta subunit
MQKRIDLQEHTYLRLVAVLDELARYKTRDMTFDDVINDLIDIYQENSWTHFGAGAKGG